MNESEQTPESESEPSRDGNQIPAVDYRTIAGVRDPISKVGGASIGALIIALAYVLHLPESWRFGASEAGLGIATIVSMYGPTLRTLLMKRYRAQTAQSVATQLEELAKKHPDDPDLQRRAKEARNIIADALSNKIKKWHDEETLKSPPKKSSSSERRPPAKSLPGQKPPDEPTGDDPQPPAEKR